MKEEGEREGGREERRREGKGGGKKEEDRKKEREVGDEIHGMEEGVEGVWGQGSGVTRNDACGDTSVGLMV